MKNKQVSALAAAITATLGSAGVADAASVTATLVQNQSFSGNGSSAANLASSTATWSYETTTGVLTQTGGTFNTRFTIVPSTTLFRHSITGLVIGNAAAASATSYTCAEGNFGGGVGASLCGNYNFGANFTNESAVTWGPGTATARTIVGDDMALGPQQSIAAYDGFAEVSWVGTTLTLSNAFCNPAAPGNANGCATTGGANTGYTWILEAAPATAEPTANDDDASTNRNVAVDISVLANDANLTEPVTITADPAGTNGTVGASIVVNGDNTITYTPNVPAGTAGPLTDTFTYTVTSEDPDLTATVTVTVNNTVPNAQGAPGVTISTQGVAPDTVSGDFTAPGTGGSLGDATAVVSVTTPATRGDAVAAGNTITYTVTDGAFFEGGDTFEYTITDADGESSGPVAVTVTIPDVAPALAGASVTTSQDQAVDTALGVTPGNGAPEQHLIAVQADASNGSCSLSGFTLTYTPNAGFTGGDSCTVSLTDGDGDSDDATISITVGGGGGGQVTKESCKGGGWESLGFRNQGQCVASVVSKKGAAGQ